MESKSFLPRPGLLSPAHVCFVSCCVLPPTSRTDSNHGRFVCHPQVALHTASGRLPSLGVVEMQGWLRARGLAVGGRKADLRARMAAELGLPHTDAAAG